MEKKYNLEKIIALCEGEPEFMNRFISLFISTTPPQLEELNVATNDKEWSRVAAILHKIKPTIEMMGMEILPVIKQAEADSKVTPPVEIGIRAKVNEITDYLNISVEELKKELLNFPL